MELERPAENQELSQECRAFSSAGKQKRLQLSRNASVGGRPLWQSAR